jgi:hypothetical protein
MRKRSWMFAVVAATVLALASSAITGHVTVNYPDVEGCAAGCRVAGAGWPFPYLADYPGLSPAGSASLRGAVAEDDHVLWTSFVATWGSWALAMAALAHLARRRREPHARRRH